jgi:hypothetical protein
MKTKMKTKIMDRMKVVQIKIAKKILFNSIHLLENKINKKNFSLLRKKKLIWHQKIIYLNNKNTNQA